MLDQIFGVVLLGLGLKSPMTPPAVLGDDTQEENEQSVEVATSPTPTIFIQDGIPSNVSPERRELYKKEMEKRKEAQESEHKKIEDAYKAKRSALKAQFGDTKDAYRAQKRLEDLRTHSEEERKAFIESMKTHLEEAKAEREQRLEAFKSKVAAFKDEKKKLKVEDIQSRITEFVTKRIEIMTGHLTTMNKLIVLNQTQVTEKANGKDTTAFDAAAKAALTAINTAKDAILTISGKEYVVTVTSETSVRSDVQAVKNTIETDMKYVQNLIKNARIAISTMIIERAKLMGEAVPEAIVK